MRTRRHSPSLPSSRLRATQQSPSPGPGPSSTRSRSPPPNRTLSSSTWADGLYGVRHLGLGHTDNDIVVEVPDADVVFAGDLVEEGATGL
jgi:glyoxylase-like metal-dependent hydrolase (beta-lactamase superfamily II)